MIKYYFAAYLAVVLTAASQLLFKLGANRSRDTKAIRVYLDPFCLGAYALLFGVTLLNTYAYKHLPLKQAVVILPFLYILVGGLSYLFLRERLNRKQWLGVGLILAGIMIYHL